MHADPIPADARIEVERLARWWHTLPLDQALRHAPAVRALAQEFVARATAPGASTATATSPEARTGVTGTSSGARGARGVSVAGVAAELPDLGPASVVDQLTVTAYDLACADPAAAEQLAGQLADLRRATASPVRI